MNKNIIGLMLFALGFLGLMVFVNGSATYGASLNFLESSENMIDKFVVAYNLELYYAMTTIVFFGGIVILLIDPLVFLVSKIKK